MELNAKQKELLSFLVSHLELKLDLADPIEKFVWNELHPFGVICIDIMPSKELYIAFNLPTVTSGVFFAICEGAKKLAVDIIANTEELERESQNVILQGHMVQFMQRHEDREWPAGLLCIDTSLSPAIDLPNHIEVGGESYHPCLLLRLSIQDIVIKKTQGVEKLIDLFQVEDRSLVLI